MNRNVRSYLDWLQEGNHSTHLDAVRANLDDTYRSRRELAELAGVSPQYAATALEGLLELGEAELFVCDVCKKQPRSKHYRRRRADPGERGGSTLRHVDRVLGHVPDMNLHKKAP
jgi:hypothetical protein